MKRVIPLHGAQKFLQSFQKKNTNPPTYLLADYNGEKILGGFYEFELQKTNYKDDYLVEKVLKEEKKTICQMVGI